MAHNSEFRTSKSDLVGPGEEVDLWWGSYSGWTMSPSWLFCISLSIALILAVLLYVPRGFRLLVFVGPFGAVWLVQLTRWFRRVFGLNYRLTNRRLYVDRGWRSSSSERIELAEIKEIAADSSGWRQFLKLGCVTVKTADESKTPVVLLGLHDPERIAKQLRNCVDQIKK